MKRKKISKIIHYCWFGGKPIPEKTKKYIKTWREKCPDYEIIEWNESNFDVNKYQYAKEAYAAKKWAFVSDACRLEKVYEYGGIYLDINTEILKNFDRFLTDDMFIGFEQDNYVAPSVFGAEKHHSFLKEMIKIYEKERLIDEHGKINYQTINSRMQQVLLSMGLKANNKLQTVRDITIYPKEYFQPRYWDSILQDKTTKNTHTIHYYGASWEDGESRERLNFLTADDAPIISVIMPVYNVEKYLQECIDSIVNQTYSNIEIVIVDDCSNDRSGDIIDKCAETNTKIKVIHKKNNTGLASTRNVGIGMATGDYVMFVDSDDVLHEQAAEIIAKRIMETKAEVVYFEYETFVSIPNFDINDVDSELSRYSGRTFSVESIKHRDRFMLFSASACKLAISRKYLESEKIRFDDSMKRCEDYPFFYKAILSTSRITYINKKMYYYRQSRKGSITSNSDNIEYFIKALEQIRIFLVKTNKWQEYKNDFRKLVAHYLFHYTLHYKINKKYIEYSKKLLSEIKLHDYILRNNEYSETEKQLLSSMEKDTSKEIEYKIELAKPMNYDRVKTTNKKRILCPTAHGSTTGGGERSSYALWKWLNHFFDVIIALPKDTDREYLDMCQKDGISYILCGYLNAQEKFDEWTEFGKIIIDQKIDIVFPAMYLEPAFYAAAATNTPAVFLDYGLLQQLTQSPSGYELLNRVFDKRLCMSNLIITNSMSGMSAAKKLEYNHHTLLAYYYVEPQEIGHPEDYRSPRLIYPARIDSGKNQLMLLEATKLLRSRGCNTQVLLVGDYESRFDGHKEYNDRIVEFIKENRLQNTVKMTGWLRNPWSLFRQNDIYITTTKSEAVGRATTEAITAGVPILIPDIPGHREYRDILKISDKHFYQPGNNEELVEKAIYLIENINVAKAEAQIYKKRALQSFGEDECNKGVVQALQKIIGQDNPGRQQFIDYVEELMSASGQNSNHINYLETELASHLSTKRAIKLTLGNIKRRIVAMLK